MCTAGKSMARPLPDLRALEALDAGLRNLREGRQATACRLLREACFRAPTWAAAWTHLGLACVQAHNWQGSIAACLAAIELEGDGAGRRTYETVGLAATMLEDWTRARWAWRECGWHVPEGRGPIHGDFGLARALVRQARGDVEVWCRRIDPVRAHVVGVPRPEAGRRHGDLLLLLGTEELATPFHKSSARELFEELLVLETSAYRTWSFAARVPVPHDLDDLRERCARQDVHLEDWTDAEGIASGSWRVDRALGIAARDARVLDIVASWQREGLGRTARRAPSGDDDAPPSSRAPFPS